MTRLSKLYSVGILLVGLVVGAVARDGLIRSSEAQGSFGTGSVNEVGRYQMVSDGKGTMFLLDTAMGRSWVHVGQGVNSKQWENISPDLKK